MGYAARSKKLPPSSDRGTKRDNAAIRQAMLGAAGLSSGPTNPSRDPSTYNNLEDVGLPLGILEDQRWGVSPSVAQEKLREAGFPYEGRRAKITYSWPSIFRAEGVDEELVEKATRETHPYLFDDLVDTATAAALLGFKDASSIRKLIMTRELTDTAFVRFGTRKVYRFRPAALTVLRKRNFFGRIV